MAAAHTDCASALHAAYETERARHGVDNAHLSAGSVMSQATSVIIGFFSVDLFEKVANVTPEEHQWQTALAFVVGTVAVLRLQKLYLGTVGFRTWTANPQWSALLMQFMQFVSLVMLFISAHFLRAAINESWRAWHLSWMEGVVAITATMLLAFFAASVHARQKVH